MGGESVQLSQAQKRRMEAMSMNMGTRIVCGYLASLLFLGISLYLAVTYHTSGDREGRQYSPDSQNYSGGGAK